MVWPIYTTINDVMVWPQSMTSWCEQIYIEQWMTSSLGTMLSSKAFLDFHNFTSQFKLLFNFSKTVAMFPKRFLICDSKADCQKIFDELLQNWHETPRTTHHPCQSSPLQDILMFFTWILLPTHPLPSPLSPHTPSLPRTRLWWYPFPSPLFTAPPPSAPTPSCLSPSPLPTHPSLPFTPSWPRRHRWFHPPHPYTPTQAPPPSLPSPVPTLSSCRWIFITQTLQMIPPLPVPPYTPPPSSHTPPLYPPCHPADGSSSPRRYRWFRGWYRWWSLWCRGRTVSDGPAKNKTSIKQHLKGSFTPSESVCVFLYIGI